MPIPLVKVGVKLHKRRKGDLAFYTTKNLSGHTTCMQSMSAVVAQCQQQLCDSDSFRNRATLTFDLLTSGSMHAERLP